MMVVVVIWCSSLRGCVRSVWLLSGWLLAWWLCVCARSLGGLRTSHTLTHVLGVGPHSQASKFTYNKMGGAELRSNQPGAYSRRHALFRCGCSIVLSVLFVVDGLVACAGGAVRQCVHAYSAKPQAACMHAWMQGLQLSG